MMGVACRSSVNAVEVGTGEVYCSGTGEVITVSALGSCVAVVAIDASRRVGGVAHIMLPGKAPRKVGPDAQYRYAEDGMECLMNRLLKLGASLEMTRLVFVGAGNVLEREDDTICTSNIRAVREEGVRRSLRIVAECLGGTERKRVRLDLQKGWVSCAVGDKPETVIWSFE